MPTGGQSRHFWMLVCGAIVASAGAFSTATAQTPEEHDPESQPVAESGSEKPVREGKSFGLVKADSARVRGGAGDTFPEILTLERGDVVAVVGRSDKWLEVTVPGGFVVYAKKGAGSRNYVDVRDNGEGLVLVDGLTLRSKASAESGQIGRLDANDRVVCLGEDGEWIKLLAPATKTGFIWADYVADDGDQALLEKDYELRDKTRREEILKEGEITREAMKKAAEARAMDQKMRDLDTRLVALMREKDDTLRVNGLTTLAAEYEEVVARWGAESRHGARAKENAKIARDESAKTKERREVANKINELEGKAKEIDERFKADLERHRLSVAARNTPMKKDHFLFNGFGQLRVDIATKIAGKPIYTLVRGGKRNYFVVSDRYDLSDYRDLQIGITEWTVEDMPEKLELQTIRVTRLEVLE